MGHAAARGVTTLCMACSILVLYRALSYISVTILSFEKMSGKKGNLQI